MSGIESELIEMGYQILAIGPSLPVKVIEQVAEHGYHYQLLSDGKLRVADEFGLLWRMTDPMLKMYEDYGIDLEAESGEDHQMLPVPAAYIIGIDGIIDFAYVNPDHRTRISAPVLLAAARAAIEAPQEESGH
ncbi:hypothetical protein DRQ32_02445 [bacterium]|nr:MAG: hypothetical protein DRQ32_02445 [bacterium]